MILQCATIDMIYKKLAQLELQCPTLRLYRKPCCYAIASITVICPNSLTSESFKALVIKNETPLLY